MVSGQPRITEIVELSNVHHAQTYLNDGWDLFSVLPMHNGYRTYIMVKWGVEEEVESGD